jgi:hypothetical protein
LRDVLPIEKLEERDATHLRQIYKIAEEERSSTTSPGWTPEGSHTTMFASESDRPESGEEEDLSASDTSSMDLGSALSTSRLELTAKTCAEPVLPNSLFTGVNDVVFNSDRGSENSTDPTHEPTSVSLGSLPPIGDVDYCRLPRSEDMMMVHSIPEVVQQPPYDGTSCVWYEDASAGRYQDQLSIAAVSNQPWSDHYHSFEPPQPAALPTIVTTEAGSHDAEVPLMDQMNESTLRTQPAVVATNDDQYTMSGYSRMCGIYHPCERYTQPEHTIIQHQEMCPRWSCERRDGLL